MEWKFTENLAWHHQRLAGGLDPMYPKLGYIGSSLVMLQAFVAPTST